MIARSWFEVQARVRVRAVDGLDALDRVADALGAMRGGACYPIATMSAQEMGGAPAGSRLRVIRRRGC